MELQLDDEEKGETTTSSNDADKAESTPASQQEAEPRANFEIDISDANIDVGRKSSRRAASSSKASAAPPMSPETPSLSPTSSAKPSAATGSSAQVPRGMCHILLSVIEMYMYYNSCLCVYFLPHEHIV